MSNTSNTEAANYKILVKMGKAAAIGLSLRSTPENGEFTAAWYRVGQLAASISLDTDYLFSCFGNEWPMGEMPSIRDEAWSTIVDGYYDAMEKKAA